MTDAIPMVGTDASIELMKTLISNEDVKGSMADMWLASLAFVHHPTSGMIKHLQVGHWDIPLHIVESQMFEDK